MNRFPKPYNLSGFSSLFSHLNRPNASNCRFVHLWPPVYMLMLPLFIPLRVLFFLMMSSSLACSLQCLWGSISAVFVFPYSSKTPMKINARFAYYGKSTEHIWHIKYVLQVTQSTSDLTLFYTFGKHLKGLFSFFHVSSCQNLWDKFYWGGEKLIQIWIRLLGPLLRP